MRQLGTFFEILNTEHFIHDERYFIPFVRIDWQDLTPLHNY